MTRFEKELNGELGTYWKETAEKEITKIKEEVANGEITIDANGVARNCIGRILMDDMAAKLEIAGINFSKANTEMARSKAVSKQLNEYRIQQENKKYSEEEKSEMRAAFGSGETVVNIITGEKINL